ncbi:MAG: hypothetical protein LBF71_05695 [Campylobacteraceae bacterium]|nr:hypothetical protein [Campylobacteraceae bacterium]
MKKEILVILTAVLLFLTGCGEKTDFSNPVSVLKNFILLCEKGKIDEAQQLLAPSNNVDYFKKFREMNGGKDLIYIDYDYNGNDEFVKLDFELLPSGNESAAYVKLTSTYLAQQNSTFEKEIVLHKIDGRWKIYDYLLLPVKVK